MICKGCGVNKDMNQLEAYSHPEDERLTDKPIPPLLSVELDVGRESVLVCHECFHRLQPDMWIDERIWLSINPITPYQDLLK